VFFGGERDPCNIIYFLVPVPLLACLLSANFDTAVRHAPIFTFAVKKMSFFFQIVASTAVARI
jgi:hypothetical protein